MSTYVHSLEPTVWKLQKFSLTFFFFCKNFVKAMVLLKKLLNSWFDEKIFREGEFFVFPHCAHSTAKCQTCECTVWKKREILSQQLKKNSSNQLFSNFFSKTIAFTKFLRKKCEREFLQFPHCAVEITDFTATVFRKNSVKLTFSLKSQAML